MAAKSKSNELKLSRIYDAPVKTVWDAWTDPDQVAQWWGPRGFTLTTHSKDLRPGGTWVYTMHGPDGVDYPNRTYYYEVEECSRLVYDHGASEDRPPLFRVTVVFAALPDGRTSMEMTMAFTTPQAAEESRAFIKKAGGESTWDRLGEYLAKRSSDREVFIINRSFSAPIDTVFKMWSEPEHLSRWMPPVGMEMKVLRGELRAGGRAFYLMSGAERTMYGRLEYLEVERPTRLVYTQQFCDEHEQVIRAPFHTDWPEAMLTTVTLTEERPGSTRVTVTWEPRAAAPKELAAFRKEKPGMTQGWTGSFDKLETHLETVGG